MNKGSEFIIGEPHVEETWKNLPRCPRCKKWISKTLQFDRPFNCNWCGAILSAFPVYDEEGNYLKNQGEICAISKKVD